MKIEWGTVVSVAIALVLVNVLNKMFLDEMIEGFKS